MSCYSNCAVCGKRIEWLEEEAFELLYWPKDDDACQIKMWHAKCYREKIEPLLGDER